MDSELTFSKYQTDSRSTDGYHLHGDALLLHMLGLTGEVGELAEKIKKVIRNKARQFEGEDLNLIQKEIGDILWYLAQVATDLGIDLGKSAAENRQKLLDRQNRNAIKSEGDER